MADTTTVNYGWVKPTVNADLNLWGGLLNTNLDNQDSTVHGIDVMARAAMPTVGGVFTGGVGATQLTVVGQAGTQRNFVLASGVPGSGVPRWLLIASAEAEGPVNSNNGSNFYIQRMNDAGVGIDNPLEIVRSTGQVIVGAGGLVVNGPVSGVTAGVLSSFNGRTTPAATLTGADVNNAVGFAIQSAAGAAIGTSGGTLGLLNTNVTWSGSFSITGAAYCNTAAVGDSSSLIANTSFVASRGWQSRGQVVLGGGTITLDDTNCGADIICAGGSTINLPSTARTYVLMNVGRPFIDPDVYLTFPNGSDFRTVLRANERVVLCGDGGGYWRLAAAAFINDPHLYGLPITSSPGDHTIGPSDYGGCVHVTGNGSVFINASMPLGTVVEISCDPGVQCFIRYPAGTLRTVPANSTAGNAVMNGPGSTFIEQKKTSEIWARGDAV
jgi:hypothetical protein